MVASCSVPRVTDTALREISNSPVTFTPGAFARSQALKSFRSAERLARYAFTVALSKSIFLPCGGFVFADVARGSPFNWTMAEPLSCPGREAGPSEEAPTAVDENAKSESRAMAANGRNVFTCPPLAHDVPLSRQLPGRERLARFGRAGRARFTR